jgi:hypothetical protein
MKKEKREYSVGIKLSEGEKNLLEACQKPSQSFAEVVRELALEAATTRL